LSTKRRVSHWLIKDKNSVLVKIETKIHKNAQLSVKNRYGLNSSESGYASLKRCVLIFFLKQESDCLFLNWPCKIFQSVAAALSKVSRHKAV
jgi:mevalonate pyrophosphate decarboxylase